MNTRFVLVAVAMTAELWGHSLRAAEQGAVFPLDAALQKRCLEVLRAGLASDEFWPAMHAAEALTLAGERAEVLAALAKRAAKDDQERCGLAREAVRAGDRRKIATLVEILVRPGSIGHTHAAESLFKVAEVGDGEGLRRAMAQSENMKLKLMAAAALARGGHPTALNTVRAELGHSDVEIRKSAVWILGQLGGASDVPHIRYALQAATEPLARAYCEHALALLGDREGKAGLGRNLRSPLPAVRTYAAEFAGYCRAGEFRERLIEMLEDETLDVRVRAAQSLIVLSQSPYVPGLPPYLHQGISRDVYPATAEHPRYSEGSVVVLADGLLLFATTEFIGGAADQASARIVGRTSRDGGQSWDDARVLQENTGKQNVMSVTLRRLLPGRYDGPLGLFYLVKNGPADLKVYLRISSDEARTFGERILVTDGRGYHVMNNDRVTVLKSGRLVCPIAWTADVFGAGGGHFVSACFLSDDSGGSWRRSADHVDVAKRGAMEPEVVEQTDDKLLMIVRTQLGHIATSVSIDGGDHWSSAGKLSVQAPKSPATIRRIPATNDLLLIWNNTSTQSANHGGKRTPLSAVVSSDEGQTWRHLRELETNPDEGYAYTSIAFYRDRALLTYYVSDSKTGRISSRFRSLPVSWFYAPPE